MHAHSLCHRWLLKVLPEMHNSRVGSLTSVVSAALRGCCLTVTFLGRSIAGEAKEKHNIKRADRLLSNLHLLSEHLAVYRALSREILGGSLRPIVLIDWAHIDEGKKFYLLRAATPVQGRSLTLYEEVHTAKTKEKPKTHREFLRNLAQVLPPGVKPVLVSDAGFRVPWFKQVLARGWDFIGRVRNRDMVCFTDTEWAYGKSLYTEATSKAKLFESAQLSRSNPLECSLVLYKGKPKGRKFRTRTGKHARSRRSTHNSARSREPWLLATSLSAVDAEKIVRLYGTRMQIEEAFRDLKNARSGLGLEYSCTYQHDRMKNLVLIGTLALMISWLIGTTTLLLKKHFQFQANTERKSRVLSASFLGIQVFKNIRLLPKIRHFAKATANIRKRVLSYALGC